MKKNDEVLNPGSTLNKAGDDEMLFILRGQDVSSPKVVLYWMQENIHLATLNPEKYREAFECLMTMANTQGRKSPD